METYNENVLVRGSGEIYYPEYIRIEVGEITSSVFDLPEFIYAPISCVECLDFIELMNTAAMHGLLWGNRHSVIAAFQVFHHLPGPRAIDELRGWALIRTLQKAEWPDEWLRRVAELADEAGL